MFKKLKESNFIQNITLKLDENIIWIYPLGHMLIALILSYVVINLDIRGYTLYRYVPRIFLTSVSLSRTILGALTSSLLTITTFTFSTIITVLTMYSSDFSPRIVENFLKEKLSLKVLGMFLGGFFYSITSLLFMRDTLESELVISASIGVIYAALCCVYFVRFIYKVSTSIQASYVINSLIGHADELLEDLLIDRTQKLNFVNEIEFDFENSRSIVSNKTGYVQLVATERMFNNLDDLSVRILVCVKVGDFVAKGQEIAKIIEEKEEEYFIIDEVNEENIEIAEFINSCITVEYARNEFYDYRYSIQKVEEVAVRALSPGVNDPYTAIECINSMSKSIRKLADWNNGYYILEKDDPPATLYTKSISFEEDLYDFFSEIILYGASDLSVIKTLFNAYKTISSEASKENLKAIKGIAEYTYEKSKENFTHNKDKKFIDKQYYELTFYLETMNDK